MGRKVVLLVFTLLAATGLAHVFFAVTLDQRSLAGAIADTPSSLVDRFVHGDFGTTGGTNCTHPDPTPNYIPLCSSYSPSSMADMLRERVPIDIVLLVSGLLIGTLLGVAGGRWCARRPDTRVTRALHGITAVQLSSPPFFQALVVLIYVSSNAGELVHLPFISSQGDYVPFADDPLGWVKAVWVPCLLTGLPLAAVVLRLTETTLRESLQQDFIRTAIAKGISERRMVNLHALPVASPGIVAMVGANVGATLLTVAVMEYAFALPGMFRVIYSAALFHDVPVLEALVIEGVVLVTIANFLVDAFQTKLDPRIARL